MQTREGKEGWVKVEGGRTDGGRKGTDVEEGDGMDGSDVREREVLDDSDGHCYTRLKYASVAVRFVTKVIQHIFRLPRHDFGRTGSQVCRKVFQTQFLHLSL